MTWPVLDNRPLHALISTRVEQTLLGGGDVWGGGVLTQEGISEKRREERE